MDNLELGYFGTDDSKHGHYIWKVGEQYLRSQDLNFSDFPFNPESIAKKDQKNIYSSSTGLNKGDVRFFKVGGYSICYIEGSAVDDRGGTKSVWWVKADVTLEKLKELILANIPSAKLISMMEKKFKINWEYEGNAGR